MAVQPVYGLERRAGVRNLGSRAVLQRHGKKVIWGLGFRV